ncbi:hypothetical protein [Raoultella ornithinolytica]|uniref:hypothetical protein n=1 Tax=Raoultella ornithinolytica TaxID=54291 RepID=UPI003B7B5C52
MNYLDAILNTVLFTAGIIFFGGSAFFLWGAGRKKMSFLYCSAILIFALDIYLAWTH